MKAKPNTASIKTTVSTRIPPWFGYRTETVQTIKVGKFYVTAEVMK